MSWLVCSDRDGNLYIMTRQERETMLSVLMDAGKEIPHFVVKVFDGNEDAIKYIQSINEINNLLNSL